ncbi:hypothetical protein HPP92_008466 [Vanilla planifolia]|uniref:Ribosomal protein S6 n=1 Tax=Vanilla planifolia TaxID=51239 RepID=A0A835V7X8_VANPL|nr:hypothetical protein HPP92_008466 [Vanilla planifolia]
MVDVSPLAVLNAQVGILFVPQTPVSMFCSWVLLLFYFGHLFVWKRGTRRCRRSNPNDLGHSGASVGRTTARREGREEGMPLYDCLLLAKNTVNKEEIMGMMTRLGRRVLQRNGVITDIKSFGKVELGYGIKKLDGRHYQGHLMQMTMMVPPSFPKDLQILNNEDRLLRWLVVKHRKTVYGLDSMNEDDGKDELNLFRTGSSKSREDLDDNEEDEDDDEEEYEQE